MNRWYQATPEERATTFRSVYPIGLLNAQQLSQSVRGERSLEEFIRKQRHHSLRPVGNLFLWEVPESRVRAAREKLKATGALLT